MFRKYVNAFAWWLFNKSLPKGCTTTFIRGGGARGTSHFTIQAHPLEGDEWHNAYKNELKDLYTKHYNKPKVTSRSS